MAYRRTPAIQARLEAQRQAILTAASDLLGERGYAACSVAAVAARAGISTGSVYTHFARKSDLEADLFRETAGHEIEAVREAVDTASDSADAVRRFVETFASRALRAPRRAYALLAEPVDPNVERLRLEYRRAYRSIVAGVIDDGIRAGDFPHQDADISAAALVGAVAEALVAPLAGGHQHVELVPALVRFALRSAGGLDRVYA